MEVLKMYFLLKNNIFQLIGCISKYPLKMEYIIFNRKYYPMLFKMDLWRWLIRFFWGGICKLVVGVFCFSFVEVGIWCVWHLSETWNVVKILGDPDRWQLPLGRLVCFSLVKIGWTHNKDYIQNMHVKLIEQIVGSTCWRWIKWFVSISRRPCSASHYRKE